MINMSYLFGQSGLVEEIFPPGKAILTFNLRNQPQRVLLWIKSFVYKGKNLEQTDNFIGKLNVGDKVTFDCHPYNKESRDNCQWFAAKATKEDLEDFPQITPTVTRIMNQNGYISEIQPGKGVILFEFQNREERVFFMRSKFYYFGKRPAGKHSLREFLSENDPLQFDAEQCEPNEDNFKCNWFACLVWKGKKPQVAASWTPISGIDDISADDSASNVSGVGRETFGEEFPTLGLPRSVTEKQGYKAFEVNNALKSAKGNVLSLFNEECGIALWMVRRNTWETVFFHRKNSFLDDVSLSNYDLRESFSEGTALELQAVPAIPEFPCRWIARKAVARC
ncbi:uncharacterized protein [Palaemon carinicauda]|uniref:uncharacterized protein isoform X1 n=1 Tax=Palaemon carinicauda TaxID=392227 RepID=UPI0035B66A26